MKDEIPSKKEQSDSNNKIEENPNLTASPKTKKETFQINDLSPENNLNEKFFPSKENYFGVKTSPTRGMGKTSSSGNHSPILNYYANVSPEGKDYYYSPKESANQNSFNSNKISPLNFNFSPSNIFINPKNNNQNKESNENDSQTLQEKMAPLVSNLNNDNNNLLMRTASFPSNESNIQENKNEEEDDDEDGEEILTLNIDSGDEDYLLGKNEYKNIQFGNLNEQDKNNKDKNINNNKIVDEKEKKKVAQEKKEDNNEVKQIFTIYNNIQKSYNDNKQKNNNNINNYNLNNPNLNVLNENNDKNINNNINNNNNNNNNNNKNNNNFNYFNMNNPQKINQQQKPEGSLVQNIINKQEFKPYIPNKFRNQFQEQEIPNYYYNNMNYNNMNMNYLLNRNYPQENVFKNPYNQFSNTNIMNSMNNNYINKMNNRSNAPNNYYPNNNNIFHNPYILNNKIPNNMQNNNQFNTNNFIPQMKIQMNNNYVQEPENNNSYNNFIYNGDKYQISNSKEYKEDESGKIRAISESDIVTAITANNKVIKRIDPNTYLNASLEYLSYNITPLAKDQAGCRFLQEKLEKDPNAINSFYKTILPSILSIIKDPFGNYLIQKICNYLDEERIKKLIEIISPNILDIGSNSHGTRVIQHLVNFLNNKDLVEYFLNILKPHVIPLLKELNGTHIINKFITEHPECAEEINKIIIENSSTLATHRHGCCILQRLLDGPDKKLKADLIANLIENCFVLIIDQFGNYVIQSILLLNIPKASGAIAMKICDNLQYYSKHRYSSNVIEKCFDYCGKKERKILVQKICSPEVVADLILDEHGNYVVQKALYYADQKEKEIILNNIIMLIPKIRCTVFGEKLLNRLVLSYPILNNYLYDNYNLPQYMQNLSLENNNNNHQKNKKKKGKKNKKNNINNNNNEANNANDNMFFNNNNPFLNNNNFMNNNINVSNNITINNYNNINNEQTNSNKINNQNNETIPQINYMNYNNNLINNDYNQNPNFMQMNMNNNENENKKKSKRKRKNKNKKYNNNAQNNQYENNEQEEIDNNQNEN